MVIRLTAIATLALSLVSGTSSAFAQTVTGRISIPSAFYESWPVVNQTVRLVQLRELPQLMYDLCREHDMQYRQLAEIWYRVQRERRSGRYTALGLEQLASEQAEITDSIIELFQWTADWMREGLDALTLDEAFTGIAARYEFEQIPPGEYALWAETSIAGVPHQWWTEFTMASVALVTLDLDRTVFAETGLPLSCERFGFGEWRSGLGRLPERRWMRSIQR